MIEPPPNSPSTPEGATRRVNARFLRSYVGDHVAVAAAVGGLARRMASAERWRAHRPVFEALVGVLAEDERELQAVLSRRGIRRVTLKALLARRAELGGRLKVNGRIVEGSPLTRLVELDGLRFGLAACEAPWAALREVGVDPDRADAAVERLRQGREPLERLLPLVAASAFAD